MPTEKQKLIIPIYDQIKGNLNFEDLEKYKKLLEQIKKLIYQP